MERSQILDIGVQSVFELSLRNLPARLSTSKALLLLNSFNIFKLTMNYSTANKDWSTVNFS